MGTIEYMTKQDYVGIMEDPLITGLLGFTRGALTPARFSLRYGSGMHCGNSSVMSCTVGALRITNHYGPIFPT